MAHFCSKKKKLSKFSINQETALPCARLKEDDELHLQGYPHKRRRLQKFLEKNVSPVKLLKLE